MSDIQLFRIASQQAGWLAARQKVIASNIANAATPGFKASDVVPFASVLHSQASSMTMTNSRHLNVSGQTGVQSIPTRVNETGEVDHSGNNVSIEAELMKGGEIARAYSLNTNIVKTFHRMLLQAVKG